MPGKLKKNLAVYALFGGALVLMNTALPQVPTSVGLLFALLACGGSLWGSPLLYLAAEVTRLDWRFLLCGAVEAGVLTLVVFLYRYFGKKMRYEATVYLFACLLPYFFLCEWTGLEAFDLSPYALKGVGILLCLGNAYVSYRVVHCLLFRLCRCKLRDSEVLCLATMGVLCGVGLYRAVGNYYYALFLLTACSLCVRTLRSFEAVGVALIGAIPQALMEVDPNLCTVFCLGVTADLYFLKTGRYAVPCLNGATFVLWQALSQNLGSDWRTVIRLMAVICCVIICTLPTDERLKEVRELLTAKPVLPQKILQTERARTGERLFRMAEVFREIENAFCSMDESMDEEGAKKRMLEELKRKACGACPRRDDCVKSAAHRGFLRLVTTGCIKGKVNLIDVPSDMTSTCNRPTEVILILNGLLAEYRRCMLDAENARSGRALLAGQARGVADVMKDVAVSLCHTDRELEEWQDVILDECLTRGLGCSEAHVAREGREITLVLSVDDDINEAIACLKHLLGRRFVLRDKARYNDGKCYYRFVSPPKYDALFGMATTPKQGERLSGDTHSVIKINERSFLMTLSDGMGSGDYAHKVSATAISLIESFYRAEMPRDNVLDTINKVLSFNRDERFACIDVVAVDLETGHADFVKIGSPCGLIVRQGEMKVLQATGLPLGILENLHPTVTGETLRADDMIVFMSDGVTSAFGSDTELMEYLQTLRPLNPQSMAETLLDEALKKTGNVALDDMTVLCTRLFEPTF